MANSGVLRRLASAYDPSNSGLVSACGFRVTGLWVILSC